MPESSAEQTRRLVVVRHARAAEMAQDDHARPLTDVGVRAAASVGRWLGALVPAPDHALVSDALRARQTWQGLSDGAGWSLVPEHVAALYSASVPGALDLVREVPDGTGTLIVVGHNPTVAILASLLDDGQGDPDASIALTREARAW